MASGSGNKLSIASIYIPPLPTNPTGPEINTLLAQIPEPRFFIGDFNAHGQQWGCQTDDRRAQVLVKVFDDNNLVSLNTGEPTRVACPPIASSALDISLCTSNLGLACSWQVINDPHGSDHLPIIITYHLLNDVPAPAPVSINLIKNIVWDEYTQLVSRAAFITEEPEMYHYEQLVAHIKNSAIQAQSKPIANFRYPSKHVPKVWWTQELNDRYTHKREAFRVFKRIGGRNEFLNYKKKEAEFKRLKKQLKTQKWREYCSTLNKDTPLSAMYSMAKKFRGCISNRNMRSDEWIQDFISKLAPPTSQNQYPNYNAANTDPSMFDAPFTTDELESALQNCNNSCPGLDLINFRLLKELPSVCKLFLIKLFNHFVVSENIPESWYDCKVITIHKPGKNPLLAASYRPICLLSCLRKVFEKILHSRLDYWLESNKLGPATQFGFRKGFGTTDCLAILSTDLQTCYANKSICLALFMDISAAYDDVQIDILCGILSNLQLPRIVVKMIHLLFHKRHLKIYHNNISIDERIGYKGLAQGSSLSPLLYNIYTRKIEQNLNCRVKILQYADDVVVYSSGLDKYRIQNDIQATIDLLHQRYNSLGLDISPSKTKYVVFTRKYKVPPFTLNLNNRPLEQASSFKYLGVVFDAKCLWKEQVNYVTKKCAKRVNFLRTVSGSTWGAHPTTLLTVYKSTIRSILDYGAIAIYNLANTHKLRLERVQWRALRVCLGLMTSTHTKTLEVQAGILPLDLRWKETIAKFICKSIAGPNRLLQCSIESCLAVKPDFKIGELFNLVIERNIPTPTTFSCYKARWACLMFSPNISLLVRNRLRTMKDPTSSETIVAFEDAVSALGPAKLIFTDGSKSAEGTGSGMYSQSNKICISQRLQEPASVFTAELTAINIATEFVKGEPPGNYIIATDSMSSIEILTSRKIAAQTPNIIHQVLSNLYDLQCNGHYITLLWIPAHRGIPGNEQADTIAKLAATTGPLSEDPVLWQDCIPHFRALINQQWQDIWASDDLGRYYFSINPRVSRRPWYETFDDNLDRPCIRIANRLAANHYCLNHHLNRVNITESPMCQHCNANYESADHVLFQCQTLRYRDTLESHLVAVGARKPFEIRNILATCRHASTIREISSFLKKNNIQI